MSGFLKGLGYLVRGYPAVPNAGSTGELLSIYVRAFGLSSAALMKS